MILEVADKLANYLSHEDVIHKEIEIYRHGIALYISEFLSFGCLLLISVFTKHTLYAIIYILLFTRMREILGGFHCKHFTSCILTYIGIYGIFEIFLHIMIPHYFQLFSSIPMVIIIWKLAPVEHVNKELNKEMKEKFQKKAKQLIVTLFLCFLICSIDLRNISYIIWYCICANMILMVLGKEMRWKH